MVSEGDPVEIVHRLQPRDDALVGQGRNLLTHGVAAKDVR